MITNFKIFEEFKFKLKFKKFEILYRNSDSDFYLCLENSKNDRYIKVIRIGRLKYKKYSLIIKFVNKINEIKIHQNTLSNLSEKNYKLLINNNFDKSDIYNQLVEKYNYDFKFSKDIYELKKHLNNFNI